MSRHWLGVALLVLLLTGSASAAGEEAPANGANPFVLPSDAALSDALKLKLKTPDAAQQAGPNALLACAREMSARYRAIDYDPAERARSLGAGVEPVFNYVRDHIRFEAYPGVLRGAAGAYRSRAGNAADRSLLLAEMLKTRGIATRFAWGSLPREQADVLFNHMFDPPAVESPVTATNEQPDAPESQDFIQRLRARATRDYATIQQALQSSGAGPALSEHQKVIDEIIPHVWVQTQVDGNWVDLDASFADAAVGKRYCDAVQTADALPDDRYQTVTVRLVVETLENGELKRRTHLEHPRRVVDLLERQVFLLHSRPTGVKGIGQAIGGAQAEAWVPSLWIDGELYPGEAVQFVDSTPAAAEKPQQQGGFADVFDTLDSKPAEQPKADAAGKAFVAEVLEFEISQPGGTKEVVRRALVDRASPAWRKAMPLNAATLAPLPRDANGPLAALAIHNVWFSAARHDLPALAEAVRLFAEATGSTSAAPAAPPDDAQSPEVSLGQQLWPIALQNLACMLWGDHAFVPALNDAPEARFYQASPRICLFSLTAEQKSADPEDLDLYSTIDLRRDTVRGVARDDKAAAEVVNRKIWYGVLEGALEHELAAQQAMAVMGNASTVASTSGLLDDSGAVLLKPGQESAGAPLAANTETAARLADDLAAGHVLVVPRAALNSQDSGWWAISAQGGDTRAVWAGGLHGAGGKYTGLKQVGPRPGGGSAVGKPQYVDPNTGNSYTPKRTNASRGGGSEEATILVTVSIPGAITIRITVGHVVIAATTSAVAILAYKLIG